jgi:hypothetical protein
MQEVEGIVDESRAALAVGRCLRLGEARQTGLVKAAELAVDVGGLLHPHIGERRDGAWIFVGPVEPGPRQKLHATVVDPRGHAKAVEFDFMQPLRPRGRLLDRLGKLRRNEARKGRVTARSDGLEGLRGRTLDDTRHRDPTPMHSPGFTHNAGIERTKPRSQALWQSRPGRRGCR